MVEMNQPRSFRWPKSLYYQMGEMGWFRDKRVELLNGEIIEMAPMGTLHLTGVGRAGRTMMRVFGEAFLIVFPGALDIDGLTELEPDVAVLNVGVDGLASKRPEDAVLVIEVSDSSLHFDRTIKSYLYAKAGITDYWIVNLNDRAIEVYRDPTIGSDGSAHYAEIRSYRPGEAIAPLASPENMIAVSDLLPADSIESTD